MEDNWSHPELRKGEVFFSNMTKEQFEMFPYVSKRRGEVAYDGEGARQQSSNWFPVFMEATEVERVNGELADLRRSWRIQEKHLAN